MFCRASLLLIALILPAASQDRKAALAEQLLTATKADRMADQMLQQISGVMQRQMEQQHLPPALKPKMDQMMQEMMSELRAMLDWKTLKGDYAKIYSDNFSEQELQAIVDFYKSPAGQVYVDKIPAIMAEAMQQQEQRIGPLIAHLQERIRKLADEPPPPQPNGPTTP